MEIKSAGSLLRWILVGVIAMTVAVALQGVRVAHSTELVPSVGLTRSVDSDDAKSNVGLALRGNLVGPQIQAEIAASYRKDEFFNGGLEAKMIPVTASVLVRPIPAIHGDVGAGWYHTKYDYANPLIQDETKQQFGVHVGGGLQVPLAPRAALDMTGRYVFLEEQESKIVPEKFNPDFWSMTLGLALKF